jgi:hypothetical protein
MIGRGLDGPGTVNPDDRRDRETQARDRETPSRDRDSQVPTGRAGDDEPGRVWTNNDFTVDNDLAGDDITADDLVVGMPTRPVIGPAIRRTARWWCAAGLVGLVLGAGIFTKLPPPYKATSTVLLVQPPGQQAADVMLTELVLADSHTVAGAAMRKLGLPVNAKSIQAFLADYTATSPSDRVILFTAKSSSSSIAVSRARAVAAAFLQVWDGLQLSEQNKPIAAIKQQLGQAQEQVNQLTTRIRASPPPPDIDTLKTELADAKAGLTTFRNAVQDFEHATELATASQLQGSVVLGQPTPLPRSHLKYPVLYIGGGLVAGLALGLGVVVVVALVSTRFRRRDDIARALGAPVRLSLGRVRLGGRGLAAADGRDIRQIVAHLRRLVPGSASGAHSLALVAVDEPDVAAVALVSLALSSARDGKRVIIADLSPDATAGRLLGTREPGVHTVTAEGQRLVVAIPEPDDIAPVGPLRDPASGPDRAQRPSRSLDRAYASADVRLALTVLDPALWADHLATWATDSVVVLTAGESTGTKVHTIGQMIRLARVSLVSAILLGADKRDVSLGVPDFAGPADLPRADEANQPAPAVPGDRAARRDGARGEIAPTTVGN